MREPTSCPRSRNGCASNELKACLKLSIAKEAKIALTLARVFVLAIEEFAADEVAVHRVELVVEGEGVERIVGRVEPLPPGL